MTDKKDDLGDRLKRYESVSTAPRAFKGQPLIARLDGRSFHTFTRGMKKPYDEDFMHVMLLTMQYLVEQFHPLVAYTQSDEFTLAWYYPSSSQSEYIFDGRFQKLDSILASAATAKFNSLLPDNLPTKTYMLPTFDCRTFVVPNLQEAYHMFLWRQQDATKNAIQMAAQSMFSHNELQNLHSGELQEKMFADKGVNFNDYPPKFKRGTFCKKVMRESFLPKEILDKMKPEFWPKGPVLRPDYPFTHEWLTQIEDPVSFLFGQENVS